MIRIYSLQRYIFGFAVVALAVLVTGCVSPKAVVKKDADLRIYRKVYLPKPKEDADPRKIEPRLSERLKKAGFEVVEINPEGDYLDSQGSGFVISPDGLVLTCAHVVGKMTNATVWIQNVRHVGRVVASDTNLDVAVIRLEKSGEESFTPLTFSPGTNYAMGQDVFSIGFPLAEVLGVSPRLNKGLISSTVGLADDPKQIQVSVEVQPGNSGSPLLDSGGNVIGVVSATLNPYSVRMRSTGNIPQNVNFAIKRGPIAGFLADSKISLPAPSAPKSAEVFEQAKNSIALVRAGIVTDEQLKEPSLYCSVNYVSMWDVWFRFRLIELRFLESKNGEVIFKVGQYRDDPLSTEDGELDRLFVEISDKFFPDKPNPFKSK